MSTTFRLTSALALGVSALAAPTVVEAQRRGGTTAEQALRQSFVAEHRAWEEDIQRWRADHERAIQVLAEMQQRFRGGDNRIAQHMAEITRHGGALARGGLADMADTHARTRVMHEEMRESHHHVMDAVAMLQQAIEEDLGPTPPQAASPARPGN